MASKNIGQENKRDNSRDSKRGKSPIRPGGSAVEYGKEGTNKTLPEPKADNEPSEELGNTRHVGKSPYIRG